MGNGDQLLQLKTQTERLDKDGESWKFHQWYNGENRDRGRTQWVGSRNIEKIRRKWFTCETREIQVKDKKSGFLRSSIRAKGCKDRGSKGKGSVRLASP